MIRLMTRTRREKRTCGYCGGCGIYEADEGGQITSIKPCRVCKEQRILRVPSHFVKCLECRGTGKTDVVELGAHKVRCRRCDGTGWARPPAT